MTDRTLDTGAIDAVPEADFMEQTVPAYPEDDDTDTEVPVGATEREATEADLLEQSIPVPLDDDYEDEGDAESEY
ncbi:hypothetical protein [Nocardia wallacei]|uniref:Uncharacterized protein n=1 Tax=Nocardia wallacei TaxID=480035 RepID=A0A7G1KX43_9NOCA|nr:hypothetical protein [Nocardia wallacei]BCK58763.1 hypothetical protein NWFMUON74_65350 [Nocardia wallacei]